MNNIIQFQTINWDLIPRTKHTGEDGIAYWQTIMFVDIRIRIVEYSPNYKANHWCEKGHIIYCLKGQMTTYLKDGTMHIIKEGMSYQTSDNKENPHRSSTIEGCKLFIIDGNFLAR